MLQTHFDRIAVVLSGICAIHCIALPIFAGMIPLLTMAISHGNSLHEFWFHQFILIFILPISIFALYSGYRCHKQTTPLKYGLLGLTILVFIALFAEVLMEYHVLPQIGETILTIIGGIIHAMGHIANILATRTFHANCSIK